VEYKSGKYTSRRSKKQQCYVGAAFSHLPEQKKRDGFQAARHNYVFLFQEYEHFLIRINIVNGKLQSWSTINCIFQAQGCVLEPQVPLKFILLHVNLSR